jgi:prevent-host-death family protein
MEINVAEFRMKCSKIFDQVQSTQREVIITKRGKRIAKIVPMDQEARKDPLIGALIGVGRTVEDLTQPVIDSQSWELD